MSLGICRRALLFASALVAAPFALATAAASSDASPFAEHHLVLQLSDSDPHKQALVLSVANNMLKVYGPDAIAIEVIAFGPGIDLLRADSPNKVAVDSLIAQGVTFDVCMNTVDTIARETGQPPALNDKAVQVQAGVAQILSLAEKGYTLVRP
jgi:intracellular sulfur oxidation DsrE/DsrF family protein